MSRRMIFVFVSLVLSFVLVHGQSLDEILKKHYEARGGLKNIRAIRTAEFKGKMSMMGKDFPMTIYRKRAGGFRSEFSMGDKSVLQVYDGKSGWQINPMMGSKEPAEITGNGLRDVQEQADIDGILIDWKEKGYKLSLVGKEKLNDKDAFNLKIIRKDSTEQEMFIDSKTYLKVRQSEKMILRGKEFNIVTTFSDFRKIDNVTVPFMQEVAGAMPQKIQFEKIIFNKTIPDSLFVKPSVQK